MSVRSRFGVSRDEVEGFVEGSELVKSFLMKYDGRRRKGSACTRDQNAATLCRFFKWLRLEKGWDVSPRELLNDQLRRRKSGDLEERRKHISLVMEYTRDNQDPYFQRLSDGRKYHKFVVIKSFYEYHEVQLTSAKGRYGHRQKRRHHPRQISVFDAKKILGKMKQRERIILLIMLQSGMEVGAVIYKFGYMWPEVKRQLDEGRKRIKIEITGRKGHDKWYFTYISTDAIHELKKWLHQRKRIVEKVQKLRGFVKPEIVEGTPIFITNNATPYGGNNFQQNYLNAMKKKKAWEQVSHMFRKLFKTEASVPERGIDRNIVEFWMGHGNGIEAVGGAYDRTPEIREDVIENEYVKLEPYINIYTSSIIRQTVDPLLKDIEKLSQLPGGRKFFASIVKDAKEKLSDILELQIE